MADAASFSWPGPWIALIAAPSSEQRRAVVMYGVPSGMVWDPTGASAPDREESPDDDYVPASPGGEIVEGFLIAAADIALAMPPRPSVPPTPGRVETICVAAGAGEPTRVLDTVGALAGHGLDGDRHALGTGTFPSGVPGSALTLIEAEVCESFDPPLTPDQHRRNVVTRGIDLNGLVGRRFLLGTVLCRGMRLCEPCTVVDRYAQRPVLRALVHRGGLRADILEDGEVKRGDAVRPLD